MPAAMRLEIRDARRSAVDRTWLGNVYPLYLHELSAFDDTYYQLDERGVWQPDHLPSWLVDDHDLPLLIVVDGRRVGFALVNRHRHRTVIAGCDRRHVGVLRPAPRAQGGRRKRAPPTRSSISTPATGRSASCCATSVRSASGDA